MTTIKTTGTITIDRDRAIALMKRAVDEKGADYVYTPRERDGDDRGPSCVYELDGEPSCLVGHALHYAGVTIEELERVDQATTVGIPAQLVPNEITRLSLTQGAKLAFKRAQEYQDQGEPWGGALDQGREGSEGHA